MSDAINLSARLLRARPWDDNQETDSLLQESAIMLRRQFERIAALEAALRSHLDCDRPANMDQRVYDSHRRLLHGEQK